LVPSMSHTFGTTHTTFIILDGQAKAKISSSDTTTERLDRNGQVAESTHQTQDTIYTYKEGRLFSAVGNGTTESGSNELVWTTDANRIMSLVPNSSRTFGTTHTTFVIIDGQAKAKISSSDTTTERLDRHGRVVETSHQAQDTIY